MRVKIEEMVEKNGHFDLKGVAPFKNVCISCKGSGEWYKFFRRSITLTCKFCEKGKKEIPCPDCKDTGIYKKKVFLSGNIEYIDVPCTNCKRDADGKPTGKIDVKCHRCRGTGEFKTTALASTIEHADSCRICKGRGFLLPSEVKKPMNPVITVNLADQIIKGVDTKTIGFLKTPVIYM